MSKAEIQLTAVDQTKAAIDSAKRNLQGLGDQAKALPAAFGALGISFAAAFAVSALKGVIDSADQLNKLSQKTGLATEDLSQLQYAAKLADVSNDSLATSIKKLNISIAEGLAGDKDKIALFKSLGITTKDLGKGTKEVLLQMADAYATSADGPGKVAVGNGLMGKSAEEMIPFLNAGRQGIIDLMGEAKRLGLTISTEFAKNAEDFNDNLTRLQLSGNRLAITMASDLVKGLGEAAKAMADAAIDGGKLQGILAGIRVLLTGNDNFKNDKMLVEQTDKLLEAQNKLDKLRSGKTETDRLQAEQQLKKVAGIQAEINTTLSYRKVLQSEQAATDAAAAKAKKVAEDKPQIPLQPKVGDGGAARNRELKEEAKLILELAGLSGTFTEDWDRLTTLFNKGKLSLQQLTDEQGKLLSMQPAIKKAAEEAKKHQEDLDKGEDRNKAISKKYIDGLDSESDALEKNNKTMQEHAEEIGLTGEALNAVRLARLDSNIARQEEMVLLARGLEGNEAEADQLERKLGLMKQERQITDVTGKKEVKAAEAEESRQRTQGISESISDGILDGFRDGKSYSDIFLTELKAQFGKAVLQPIISPIVQMGQDAVSGLLKGGGGGGGGGGVSGLFGGLGALGGLLGGGSALASSGTMIDGLDGMNSYDGGGFTGSGARSGGLDGIGGFLAMMHPQETVVDHSKGQTLGGDTHVQNITIGAGASMSQVVAGLQQVRSLSRDDRYQAIRRGRAS